MHYITFCSDTYVVHFSERLLIHDTDGGKYTYKYTSAYTLDTNCIHYCGVLTWYSNMKISGINSSVAFRLL